MAGSLHKDYAKRLTGDGQRLIPGSKLPRAYAEGYIAYRDGLADTANPHGALIENVDDAARAWDQGWRDGEAGHPPTHVGGPTATPPLPLQGLQGLMAGTIGSGRKTSGPKTTGRHP